MITLDTPEQINMFALVQARGRLHIELTGMRFRQSTVAALQHAGITTRRDRWGALYDLNRAISDAGGPPDGRSLALQKRLVLEGKRAPYPPRS